MKDNNKARHLTKI